MEPVTHERAYAALAERLAPRSLAHSVRVADAAYDLASVYDVDPEAARLAGLLHDWHRDTPWEELLTRAEQAGLPVTEADSAFPYLLHGPLAAVDLHAEFPALSEAVIDAIAVHTYGAADMTPLALVVYIADAIESQRDYPGVRQLRELPGSVSLEALFAEVYAASLTALIERRRQIHPRTIEAWNQLVAVARDRR